MHFQQLVIVKCELSVASLFHSVTLMFANHFFLCLFGSSQKFMKCFAFHVFFVCHLFNSIIALTSNSIVHCGSASSALTLATYQSEMTDCEKELMMTRIIICHVNGIHCFHVAHLRTHTHSLTHSLTRSFTYISRSTHFVLLNYLLIY